MRKIIYLFLGLLLVFSLIILGDFRQHSEVTSEEVFRPDEAQQTRMAEKRFVEIIKKNKAAYAGRGAHAKGHACVKAYVDVRDDLPADLQVGTFANTGKRFKAWIRFSNANSKFAHYHDKEKDAHGMAIKVLYAGLNESGELQHQDFLMADNANFFSPDIDAYNGFLNSADPMKFFFAGSNPLKWRFREFKVALETLKEPTSSLLSMQFYSNTAYKLGEENIKFMVEPCIKENGFMILDQSHPDYLRTDIVTRLAQGDACFEFRVQRQNLQAYMPIEDPSIKWKEADSPYVSVAKITIISQVLGAQEQVEFCENLSYSPWNSLPAHKPVGQLNRIRKAVYKKSSTFRHGENNRSVPTDLEW